MPTTASGTPTAARAGPRSFSGAWAARLRWFHLGLPDLGATEEAIREELRGPRPRAGTAGPGPGPAQRKARAAQAQRRGLPGRRARPALDAGPRRATRGLLRGSRGLGGARRRGRGPGGRRRGGAERRIEVGRRAPTSSRRTGPTACTRSACTSTATIRVWAVAFSAGPRPERTAARQPAAQPRAASSVRISLGSMKRTLSSTVRSSETSVAPRSRKNSTRAVTSSSGALAPEVMPTRLDSLEPALLDLAGVVDQVRLGAELAGHVDQAVRVGRVLRADHEDQVALLGELLDRELAVGRRVTDVVGLR